METFLVIISWLAPPVVGAIIGYGTNRLAIKMLFRPLAAKRILGVRVPFTPGIIPKSRAELAASVGSIVAGRLLTPEAIRQHIDNPKFRANLEGWIGEQRRRLMRQPILPRPRYDAGAGEGGLLPVVIAQTLTGLLASPDSTATVRQAILEWTATDSDDESGTDDGRQLAVDILAEIAPQLLRAPEVQQAALALVGNLTGSPDAVKRLRELVETRVARLVAEPEFAPALRQIAQTLAAELGNRRLDELISADDAAQAVSESVLPLLADASTQQAVAAFVQQQLREWFRRNEPLELTLLTTERRQAMQELVRQNLPTITAELFAVLRRPEMRSRLETMGQTAVNEVFQDQNRVVRFFVDTLKIRDEINKNMPQLIERTLNRLEQAAAAGAMQQQVVNAVDGTISRLARRGPADLVGGRSNQVITLAGRATQQAVSAAAGVSHPQVRELVDMLYKANGGMTVGQLARPETIADVLGRLVDAGIKDPATPGYIARLVMPDGGAQGAGQPETGRNQSVPNPVVPAQTGLIAIGEIVAFTDTTGRRLDRWLAEQAAAMLNEQLPAIIRMVDVEQIVTRSVGDADVAQVERMILEVAGTHLRWVTWLGAILGFLIGCLQLLLRLFG